MDAKITAKDASEFLGVTVQNVHHILKSKALDFKKSKNRVHFGHETAKTVFGLPFKTKIFTFQIVKGGTGKTSLAFNFAVRAHLYGARVLCVDLDHQANLTDFLGIKSEKLPIMADVLDGSVRFEDTIVNVCPGIDLVPSRIDNSVLDNQLMLKKSNLKTIYRDMFRRVRPNYDVIVIDCPPSLGHSVTAAALASDVIVAPVTPDPSAVKGLLLTANEILDAAYQNEVNIEIRALFNKFDKRTSLSHETLETLIKHEEFGQRMYSTYISATQEMANAAAAGRTIFDDLRDSTAKVDIDLFVREALKLDELKRLKEESKSSAKKVFKPTETPKSDYSNNAYA